MAPCLQQMYRPPSTRAGIIGLLPVSLLLDEVDGVWPPAAQDLSAPKVSRTYTAFIACCYLCCVYPKPITFVAFDSSLDHFSGLTHSQALCMMAQGEAPGAARRPAALPRSISDISETHSLQAYASLRDHGSATDVSPAFVARSSGQVFCCGHPCDEKMRRSYLEFLQHHRNKRDPFPTKVFPAYPICNSGHMLATGQVFCCGCHRAHHSLRSWVFHDACWASRCQAHVQVRLCECRPIS